MLKLAISSIFFGATMLGFAAQNNSLADETSPQALFSFIGKMLPEEFASLHDQWRSSENPDVYIYMGLGVLNIDMGDYSSAIVNFDKAESFHRQSPKFQPELDFWISFGRSIAYDNLGMSKECAQSVGSMVLIAYKMNYEDSDANGEGQENENSDENTEFLQKIASRAKSWNLRKYLMEITSDSDE